MNQPRLILCDRNPGIVREWKRVFWNNPEVRILDRDILTVGEPGLDVTLVAPGNSYGIMTGGLDLDIARRFPNLENRIQTHAPIPVGEARRFETGDDHIPHILYAPTMLSAKDVSSTRNAYRAFRAVLRFNLDRLLVPGLCGGVGRMAANHIAEQMYWAYIGLELAA